VNERDQLAAAEKYRVSIREACKIFLRHNLFCECRGCTDIVLRLVPAHPNSEGESLPGESTRAGEP
jgi:hypothetical protein